MWYFLFFILGGFFLGACSSSNDPVLESLPGRWSIVDRDSYWPVEYGVSFKIGDYVYYGLGERYIGGANEDSVLKRFYRTLDGYNWEKIASFPEEACVRIKAVAFVLNDKAYVGTGGSTINMVHKEFYKDFWCYDPTLNQWTSVPEFPGVEREGAIAFTVKVRKNNMSDELIEKGVVGCGGNKDTFLNDFYFFDGKVWEKVSIPLGSPRYLGNAFVINNIAYVFGGYKYYDKTRPGQDIVYNQDIVYYQAYPNNLWGIIKDGFAHDSLPRESASSFVLEREGEKRGYCICGSSFTDNPFYNNTCWEFNPQSNTWMRISNLSSEMKPRRGAISFSINNEGYVAFGEYDYLLSDVWSFFPE